MHANVLVLSVAVSAISLYTAAGQCSQNPFQPPNDTPLPSIEDWGAETAAEYAAFGGADNMAGSANRRTQRSVLKAAKLIKQGKVATLGKLYSDDIPRPPTRPYEFSIPSPATCQPTSQAEATPVPNGAGLPTGNLGSSNAQVFNDDHLCTSIGQIGTQFDGPGHVGIRTSEGDYYYNGVIAEEHPDTINTNGLGRLGVEHIAEEGFACRAVLLNAVNLRKLPVNDDGPVAPAEARELRRWRGAATRRWWRKSSSSSSDDDDGAYARLPVPDSNDPLAPGVINGDDILQMLHDQGLDPIQEGDCVFLYTGHGDLFPRNWAELSEEEQEVNRLLSLFGAPGYGIDGCHLLADKKIALWGADSFSSEAFFSNSFAFGGEERETFPCHEFMITRKGIWNMENLDFSQLLEDDVDEFFFVWAPLKIQGASGSPGNPMALY